MRTRRPRRTSRVVALMLGAAVLSACGSTAATTSSGQPRDPAGDGGAPPGVESELGVGTAAPDGATTTGGSLGTVGGTGTTSTGTGFGGSAGSGGGSGSSSGGGAGPATGGAPSGGVAPGITATKVFVGAPWNSDAAAGNAAIGADADSGDERQIWAAILDDLNKRGGVLGRRMEVVFAEFRASSNEPIEQQQQAACDKWTKDNKVFAVYGAGSDIAQECTRKAGVLGYSAGTATGPVLARNPQIFDPAGIRFERLAQVTVDGLASQGYFKPEPRWPTGKIGIVSWDSPDYRYAMDHGYLPTLKKHGLAPTETAYIAEPATVNALGDASAAISSAVLRFQSAGVDHVFLQDGPAGVFRGGGMTLLFLRNAQAQRYYPRYGFNANNFPGDPNLPADQQSGMLAVDFADHDPANDEGIAPNRHRERCFRIATARGVSVSDSQKRAVVADVCQFVWFVETLLERAATPTLAGAIRAGEALGSSFGSTNTYGTFIGPGRHDGVDLVRALRFDDACQCVKYTTKPYRP